MKKDKISELFPVTFGKQFKVICMYELGESGRGVSGKTRLKCHAFSWLRKRDTAVKNWNRECDLKPSDNWQLQAPKSPTSRPVYRSVQFPKATSNPQ